MKKRVPGVICDRVAARVEGKVYKMLVRPDVWSGDGGTEKNTGAGAGGGGA